MEEKYNRLIGVGFGNYLLLHHQIFGVTSFADYSKAEICLQLQKQQLRKIKQLLSYYRKNNKGCYN